jgi:DUF4097 and DUF4098 domain-containing protein YvlB
MKTKTLLALVVCMTIISLRIEAQNRRRSSSVNVDSNRSVSSCSDLQVSFDRKPAITEETQMTLAPGQVQVLRAQTSNSGIYVTGWDRAEYSVTTCKAVPADDPNANATLRDITTSFSSGQISVDGPNGANQQWMAALILMVPRISSLNLQTANGPLQVRDLAGSIQLKAANGPISLNNVGGSVQATTANGPISVANSSGDHRLSATNGPIHVSLSGSQWDGPGLEASTHNGPLSISIPENYGSGIRIQASEHSPMNCNSPVCSQAVRSLTSPSIISIGNGNPTVRLSTVNGPLSIQSASR